MIEIVTIANQSYEELKKQNEVLEYQVKYLKERELYLQDQLVSLLCSCKPFLSNEEIDSYIM